VLRRAFGWFVLAMAAFILVQEIPESFWSPLPVIAKVAVALGTGIVILSLGHFGQKIGRRPAASSAGSAGPAGPSEAIEPQARDESQRASSRS
jgi:hypothetical protein